MLLVQKILISKKPLVLFHTHSVTKNVLQRAIKENKSMDIDVCVDDDGNGYLGHSKEYHDKSGDPWEENMPLWEAVDMVAQSNILATVDCKHFDAWPVVEEVVRKIGAEKCLVHTFASELKFNYRQKKEYPHIVVEWSSIEKLSLLKNKFPAISTYASCRGLPDDLLLSSKHKNLLKKIRQVLKDNRVDVVNLNVPNETFSDNTMKFFLTESIFPIIEIDSMDTAKLSEVYIGETDNLKFASKNKELQRKK